MKRAILFFVKYPTPGKVKTRLGKDLGMKNAALVYENFVKDIFHKLIKTGVDLFICYSPLSKKISFKNLLGKQYNYLPQKGKSLGEKLTYCFQKIIKLDYSAIIVLGSDSPDLPKEYLLDSLNALEKNDSVIGPCFDGGYYLIGFKKGKFQKEVFNNIPWSTNVVFKKTMTRLNSYFLENHVLPRWWDVDNLDDLQKLYKRNQSTEFRTSQTMKFLDSIIKSGEPEM